MLKAISLQFYNTMLMSLGLSSTISLSRFNAQFKENSVKCENFRPYVKFKSMQYEFIVKFLLSCLKSVACG
jgi:hypothetical protein